MRKLIKRLAHFYYCFEMIKVLCHQKVVLSIVKMKKINLLILGNQTRDVVKYTWCIAKSGQQNIV